MEPLEREKAEFLLGQFLSFSDPMYFPPLGPNFFQEVKQIGLDYKWNSWQEENATIKA